MLGSVEFKQHYAERNFKLQSNLSPIPDTQEDKDVTLGKDQPNIIKNPIQLSTLN